LLSFNGDALVADELGFDAEGAAELGDGAAVRFVGGIAGRAAPGKEAFR
jgi:hypothetical protein